MLAFVSGTDPNQIYTHQTWERFGDGRVLMGTTDSSKIDTTVEAGLPNITGAIGTLGGSEPKFGSPSGAFIPNQTTSYASSTSNLAGFTRYDGFKFDASKSNPIYDNSDTVQPPAHLVYYWKRTA